MPKIERIKKPKKVEKSQTNYLTLEKYQDFVNSQLVEVYKKLDEIVDCLNNL